LLVTLAALAGLSATTVQAGPRAAVVHYTVYDGYFVSNEFEPAAAASFLILPDQAAFDRVFGVAAVMFDRSHRLPANIFRSHFVIAAIHRGHANVRYRVVKVTHDETVLRVSYATKQQPTPMTEYASPLILSVPRDNYSDVAFIENGSPVKTVPLTTASPPRHR
jgi:hypothetical protein